MIVKYNKHIKGFTLIELLGVITMLGIIALIITPSVDKAIKKQKEKAFESEKDQILIALKNWASDNKTLLPTLNKNDLTITLGELKQDGYLDYELKNPKTKKCFSNDNKLLITKNGKAFNYDFDGDLIDGSDTDCGTINDTPSIYLFGNNPLYIDQNSVYKEPGCIAKDTKGNNITDKINISSDIDTTKFGEYNIKYTIIDNGISKTKLRKVIVKDIEKPIIVAPKITYLKASTTTFNVMEDVSATDNSGEILSIVSSGNVSLGISGTYLILYTCTDSSGNVATFKRTVYITNEDNTMYAAIMGDKNLVNNPITQPGVDITTGDSGNLVKSFDDDGMTYYFRGNVKNNYVQLGKYPRDLYRLGDPTYYKYYDESCEGYEGCTKISKGSPILWRIMRINGDGTIRLILNDALGIVNFNPVNIEEKYAGYTYNNEADSDAKEYLDEWYKIFKNYNQNVDDVIDNGKFCSDTSINLDNGRTIYYGTYDRIVNNKPSFKCPHTNKNYGGTYRFKIGLPTIEELTFAGLVFDYSKQTTDNYLFNGAVSWTISPIGQDYEKKLCIGYFNKYLDCAYAIGSGDINIRPVINVKYDTILKSGNGTIDNPYILSY